MSADLPLAHRESSVPTNPLATSEGQHSPSLLRYSAIAGATVAVLAGASEQSGAQQSPAATVDVALVSLLAQNGDAGAIMAQAATELGARQYEEAVTTLGQLSPDAIPADLKPRFDALLAEASSAADARKAARATFEQAEKSLNDGDALTALAGYSEARGNPFADEGTVAKASEQIALAKSRLEASGVKLRDVYNDAVRAFRANDFASAGPKFAALDAAGFQPGLFARKPSQYLADIRGKASAGTATVAAPVAATAVPTEVAAETSSAGAAAPAGGEPAAVEVAAVEGAVEGSAVAPVDGAADAVPARTARDAYDAGVAAYKANDLVAAKIAFEEAKSLNYRTRLFQTSPDRFLDRIDARLKQQAAAEARAVQAATASAAAEAAAATGTAAIDAPAVNPQSPMRVTAPVASNAPAAETATVDAPMAETPAAPAPGVETPVATVEPAVAPAVDAAPATAPTAAPAAAPAAATALEATAAAERARAESAALEAASLVRFANEARDAKRYQAALDLYSKALERDPGNADAKAGVANTQAILGLDTARPDFTTQYADRIRQRQEAIRFSFNSAMEEARLAREANKFDEARNALIKAQAVRDADPSIFAGSDISSFDAAIKAEQSAIASTEAAELARVRAEEQSRRVTEQKAAAAAEETRRRETIANLTSQAQLLGRQRKYKEALAVIKQIKVIDPDNAYAISAEPLIWDAKQLQEQRQAVEAMDRAVVDVFNQAEAARVPIPEILSYPDDWPDISVRRDRTVAMERGGSIDAQTEALLDSVLPEMRFDQTAFQDVVEYLRDTTQANIFVNWNVLEAAGIDKMTQIDTRLRNIKFRKVLEIILRSADLAGVGLGYTIDDGVITISTSEDLARNTKTFTYDIRDLLVSIPTFDNAPEFNLDTGGGQGGGGSPFGGGGGGNNPDDGEADELIEQIITLITETIATDSWKDNGGLVGSIQELGGQLIITQTPENHGLITDLLRKLRETRAIQVNVEARFVTVQRNFLEEVGVDFDFQFNVDYGNFPGSGFNPNSSFSPVLVSQNLVNNDANSAARGFTSAGALISGGPGNLGQEAASNNYGTTAGISAFLDDFRASLLLRAVQLGQYTSTLTAPRITLFNGQRGWVIVSTQQSYVSDLEVVSSSGAIGFDPQVETINTGVVLDVQATVSADRKYVTLTLRPSLSRLIALRQFQVAQATAGGATGGGGGDGGQAGVALGFIQQPEIELTQLQTTVSVPDRGTLLLGGQTVSGVIERESGVPVLSKIPFLKRLFTNRGSSKDESVLLILVKPTIIIQREIEAEAYPNLQQ